METTQTMKRSKKVNVRNMVQIGMLGAVATILMLFEIPLWFAPSFYEIDLSEVAVLIGTFAMGPLAGILIELVKILLNFVLNGTITAGVGEIANFLIGCAMIIPAGYFYRKNRSKKGAMIGLIVGSISMVAIASVLNAFLLLPAYARAFGMVDMTPLIQMGSAVNPAIENLSTFVLFAVAPFNLLKAVIVSVATLLLYKKVRLILKQGE